MNIEIVKVTMLSRAHGPDQITLHTKLPSPFPPEVSDQPLQLDFVATKGMGADYVRENFGMEPEVLEIG
jgi:hypothetical protein